MIDWKGNCSPLGKIWAIPVSPGSDTDLKEVLPLSSCFADKARMDFIRELDILNPLEEKAFESLTEFPSEVSISDGFSFLKSLLPFTASCETLADFEKTLAEKRLDSSLPLKDSILIATVSEIELQTFVNNLDSVALSLYTEGKEAGKAVANFLLMGVKDITKGISILSSASLEANQYILKGSNSAGKDVLIIKISKEVFDNLTASSNSRLTLTNKLTTTCKLGSSVFWVIGFALQGYGYGGYGQ